MMSRDALNKSRDGVDEGAVVYTRSATGWTSRSHPRRLRLVAALQT